MIRTTASSRLMSTGENLLLPKKEPAVPQTTALATNDHANVGNHFVALRFPARPEMEFARMNSAETADAVLDRKSVV